MSKICYVPKSFSDGSLATITQAESICSAYDAQGYTLTLRQLYYQFVARALVANTEQSYKRIGKLVNDGRLAGLIDWDHIQDRTRELEVLAHWNSPTEVMEAVGRQYRCEKWADQPTRVEVWIEKDALIGVIENVCERNDVPYFACRGYTSQSEVWAAARRLEGYLEDGAERVVIIHLGDHDPSGIDMTRDIEDRLWMFLNGDGFDPNSQLLVERIALNMDQINQYNPPPNPAKLSDSRARDYIARFGAESWELDALDPPVIEALVRDEIDAHRDPDLWDKAVTSESTERSLLASAARRWSEVATFLSP